VRRPCEWRDAGRMPALQKWRVTAMSAARCRHLAKRVGTGGGWSHHPPNLHAHRRPCRVPYAILGAVTWGFVFLIVFLGGFTLALVTGLARRIIHPTELCDHVVEPSHEHWASQHTPLLDLVISFVTLFGLTAFLVHGFIAVAAERAMAAGIIGGIVGAALLRAWLRRSSDPSRPRFDAGSTAKVVRDIPANGYGQVEVDLGGSPVKLAARSESVRPIRTGTVVRVVDCRESVVLVEPAG